MSAIIVDQLTRRFGKLTAVDGLSFEIPHGSVCGFIGANGAGKTTTMRVIATLDYADSGRVEVCGHDVFNHPDRVRRLIGWMPDHFGNYENMTVLEYLDFYARALGFAGKERQMRVQEVMEFTDLIPLADRFSNKLSKGMTQRLGLGRSLLHDPQVMIMDEPAAGLDPQARVELKHLIRVLADEGKTIFISSHILSELGEMCDHLLFVNDGKLVHQGDAKSLLTHGVRSDATHFRIQMLGSPDALSEWASMNPKVELIETLKTGGRLKVESIEEETFARLLSKMISDGLQITDFHREERNLEDAFIDLLADTRATANTATNPPPLPTTVAGASRPEANP